MRVIAVINQKGGVAKTTTTANLGYALAEKGRKVTLIDMDPQSHLSAYLGVATRGIQGVENVLAGDVSMRDVVIEVRPNLRLVPAGDRLDRIEQMSEGRLAASRHLKHEINEAMHGQDYVLMDCPPSSGLLVIFALYACGEVLIPVNGDYLSLHGLSHFFGTLRNIEKAIGHAIKYNIVITRYYPRRRLAQAIQSKLMEYFSGRILATPIRESASLAECPSEGKTIFEYAPTSHGSDDYRALAMDLELSRVMV